MMMNTVLITSNKQAQYNYNKSIYIHYSTRARLYCMWLCRHRRCRQQQQQQTHTTSEYSLYLSTNANQTSFLFINKSSQ